MAECGRRMSKVVQVMVTFQEVPSSILSWDSDRYYLFCASIFLYPSRQTPGLCLGLRFVPHQFFAYNIINPLKPNDAYRGRTAPLTSKIAFCIFIYLLLFHNSNLFVSCIIHILYTGCAEIKNNLYIYNLFIQQI